MRQLPPPLELNHLVASWFSGTVLSTEKRSELSIQGTSTVGAARGQPAYGGIAITSSTAWTHEIWLGLPNGREYALRIPRADVPVRKGQAVSFLLLGQGRTEPQPVLLINQTAQRSTWLMGAGTLVSRLGGATVNSVARSLLDVVIASVLAVVLAFANVRMHLVANVTLTTLALFVGGYGIAQFAYRSIRFNTRKNRVSKWMAAVERELDSQERQPHTQS